METENRGGRPLFLVHGYSPSHQVWRNQLEFDPVDGHHLVAMDSTGHRDSAKLEDTHADSDLWAEDV